MISEEAKTRRRSRVEVYLHLVWTTKYRVGWLTGDLERPVHRCMISKAQEMGCQVLAVGGVSDHVHMVVRLFSGVTIMELVKNIKGASGALYNEIRPENSDKFYWQDGYGCFSLWHSQTEKAIAYVHNQKQHHHHNTLIDIFEQFDEPAPTEKSNHDYTLPDD